MTAFEVTGVVFNALSVAFTVRRHWLTWPASLVGVAAFGVLFWQHRLYADVGLQVVFFGQSIYGWWAWRQPESNRPITRLPNRTRLLGLLALLLGSTLLGAALDRWTDSDVPYADALASGTSLVANGLLALKIIDNWPLWIAVDVLYVVLFAYKGLWLTAALYAGFIGLCAVAWRAWRRAATT